MFIMEVGRLPARHKSTMRVPARVGRQGMVREKKKRRHPDSNRGIKVLQTSALPLGYGARYKKAGNETRTRDSHLGKVVLYQLSYSRFMVT